MLGVLGDILIGTEPLTGPTGDEEERAARFARHEVLRGRPILQDLGNDAGSKRLTFFFDETFCDPAAELRRLNAAFAARLPMQLFFDLQGFQLGTYLIERMRIERQKTAPSGRLVRVNIEVDLIESVTGVGGPLGGLLSGLQSVANPLLKRGP